LAAVRWPSVRTTIQVVERQRLAQDLRDSAMQLVLDLEVSVTQLRGVENSCGYDMLIEEIAVAVSQIDREIRSMPQPLTAGSTGS
jgi:hypothetical protein